MSEQSETVLAYWNEHREQFRQSETQRATLTNFLLVITAGLSGLIVQQKFSGPSIASAVLITVIGVYGAISSAKYYERAQYHIMQARALTRTLEDIGALPDTLAIETFRDEHYRTYPVLHRIRLHWLWTGLHACVAAYGVVLTAIALS